MTTVLVFRNGDGHYAVPVEHCREVRPAAEVTPLPTLEADVVGVLRWHDRALSVVAPLGPGGAHVIVLDTGAEPFALLVDAVVGIEHLEDGSVGDAPLGTARRARQRHRDGETARPAVRRRCRRDRAEAAPVSERHLVLVADDSRVVRVMLRRQLEARGLRVEEAEDGHQAVRLCRMLRPDIVLLDVEMPGLDGYTVLRILREDAELSDIPVVFLTAHAETEDVVRGLQLGAHDYLRKPFEPSELIARVSAALRVKSLQDELRRRNAELETVTRTDALTGICNRRHLEERLQGVLAAARRHRQPAAVLMIDVDHFKRVNDTLGHAGGDAVLRQVAQRLHQRVRLEDVVGRWGGEEFVVLSGATDASAAEVLAGRLLAAVSSTPFAIEGADDVTVTVSIGCAAGTDDAEALLRRADAALYEAKSEGRNRVVVSGGRRSGMPALD
jgi:two-component system cell cycle response regulator